MHFPDRVFRPGAVTPRGQRHNGVLAYHLHGDGVGRGCHGDGLRGGHGVHHGDRGGGHGQSPTAHRTNHT